MYGNIHFYAGETKYVEATASAKNPNETVVVSSAKYELFQNGRAIEEGACQTDGAKIKALLAIEAPGIYELKITACIGAEKLIEKACVKVEG